MPDIFEESGKQTQDLYSMYNEATNSPYASYVPQPIRTAHDVLLGALDGSYEKKLQEYISQVKAYELQDKQYDRLFEALRRNGINPYYMFAQGGSSSGLNAFKPSEGSPFGDSRSGQSAMTSIMSMAIGALITGLTKKPATTNITKVFLPRR